MECKVVYGFIKSIIISIGIYPEWNVKLLYVYQVTCLP